MILVTGGTGFLGSHLLFHLLNADKKIRAIKRSTSQLNLTKRIFSYYTNDYKLLFDKIEWVDADLLNFAEIQNIMVSIDEIYHVAAMVSYNPKDKNKMYENNVLGTRNIVNAALFSNINKFCYVSSIAALGETGTNEFITEFTYWSAEDGNSGYSYSKYYSELEVWRGIKEGLNACIVNPSVILGYGDWEKGSSALFPTINKGFKYYTLGSSGFIDVKDVCNIMIILMQNNIFSENFIISAENHVYKDIFTMIANALDVKPPMKYATPFLTNLAWRTEFIRCKFSGKVPMITKESANTSHKKLLYTDKKLQSILTYKYHSISEVINELGNIFQKKSYTDNLK